MNSISPDRPLRVAVAGAGMISLHHFRAWQAATGVELAAVVDPDEGRGAVRQREFNVPNRYADLDSLLDAEHIDILDIASPRETHGPLVRAALARNIATLCQKPLVPSIDEARQLIRDLGDCSTKLMVNQNFRFRPYYRQISRWIEAGALGEIASCTISCRSSGLIADADGRYFAIDRQPFIRHEPRMLVEEVLIHRIDIARWLCGSLRVVAAKTLHLCPELIGESDATILFETKEHGIPVIVDGTFAAAGAPRLSQDRVEIVGAKGRITLEDQVLRIMGTMQEEIRYDYSTAYQQSFNDTIAHFVECLRDRKPFLTSAEDNLQTLQLVEDVYDVAYRADLKRD
jgi:predicted dehydrogenase